MLSRTLRNFRLQDTMTITQLVRYRYFSSKGDDKNTNDCSKNEKTANKDKIDQEKKKEKLCEKKKDIKKETEAKPPVLTSETIKPKSEEKSTIMSRVHKYREELKLQKLNKPEKKEIPKVNLSEKFKALMKIISNNVYEFFKAPKPLDLSDGPRDEVNFPRPVRLMYSVPVRHGFIPETFFKDFYNHTGYLGPYTFFFSFGTFLFSKEIYVCEHNFYIGLTVLVSVIYVTKAFGPMLAKYLDKEIDALEKSMNSNRNMAIYNFNYLIESEEDLQWSAEGSIMLINAKKENVKLLLESIYRERQMEVYKTTKKLLDYQVLLHDIYTRYMSKDRSVWIKREIIAALTPEIEIFILKHNIEELKEVKLRIYPHVNEQIE